MQRLRSVRILQDQRGFTLIELMVVAAIIAILSAVAGPMFHRMGIREDARSNAEAIARVLATARARAMDTGINHFVVFSNPLVFATPGGGDALQIAQIVRDIDGNWGQGPADTVEPFLAAQGTHPNVSVVAAGSPFGGSPLPVEDINTTNPAINVLDDVALLGNGTTFDNAPGGFAPTVGFNAQGIPVSLLSTAEWGSGAGAVYLTDNHHAVYAVILLPLGATRVRVLDISQAPAVWH